MVKFQYLELLLESAQSTGLSLLITVISDGDVADVVDLLDPTQLEKLYVRLGLPRSVIMTAIHEEENYGDPDLKGQSVLRRWRQIQGRNATRKAILEVLGMCGYTDVKETLDEKWSKEAVGKTDVMLRI